MYLLVLSILILVIFTLVIVYYIGKKVGEHKNTQFLDSLKAYELALNQLLEEIEMVCQHNIKVMETKLNEIQELIKSADKKCVYANDLLNELENVKNEIQKRISDFDSLHAKSSNLTEKKLRLEFQSLLNSVNEKISLLEKELANLRKMKNAFFTLSENNNTKSLSEIENSEALMANSLSSSAAKSFVQQNNPVNSLINENNNLYANIINIKHFPNKNNFTNTLLFDNKFDDNKNFEANYSSLNNNKLSANLQLDSNSNSTSENLQTWQAQSNVKNNEQIKSTSKTNLFPYSNKKIDLIIDENIDNIGLSNKINRHIVNSEVSDLEPNYPFYDVIKLSNEGYSVPQIAKFLNLSKSEVELILRVFANTREFRDVL